MSKIVQIIPADGWCAEYDENGWRLQMPLACWALDEDGYIRPMAADCFGGVEDAFADNLLGVFRDASE